MNMKTLEKKKNSKIPGSMDAEGHVASRPHSESPEDKADGPMIEQERHLELQPDIYNI
jgi:hypothetical protein